MEPTIEVDAGNAGQLRDWDGSHGEYWAAQAEAYDAGVARYQPALLHAAALAAGERALDVGCGSGRVAIDLVTAVPGSSAVGVDLSGAQLEVARRRAGELPVTFLQADAQIHPFEPEAFDLIVSRTGTMFFADPAAAFANLAHATRPGGRLVMLVWRALSDNVWLQEFLGAITEVRSLPSPPPDAPGPFALSDRDRVRPLLEESGWEQAAFAALDEPMWFGPDPDAATGFIVGQMEWALAPLTPAARARATANLHEVMARHARDDGVWLGSGAWLVSARRTE